MVASSNTLCQRATEICADIVVGLKQSIEISSNISAFRLPLILWRL